jgi:two-component system response regulator CpxR
VLIVDDDFAIVETLGEIVSMEGYGFRGAANGRDALAEARVRPPAVILLDYMMPVMDGLQLLRQLRSDPQLSKVPVILMTAAPLGIPDSEKRWDELLLKPFDVGELSRALHRLIGPP